MLKRQALRVWRQKRTVRWDPRWVPAIADSNIIYAKLSKQTIIK